MQAVMPGTGCEQLELDSFTALAHEHQCRQVDLMHCRLAFEVLHNHHGVPWCFVHLLHTLLCDVLSGSQCISVQISSTL